MSVVVRHMPQGLTREKYDDVSRQMESAGNWPPESLDMHVLFGSEGELRVSEIWDSADAFREFFDTRLVPALNEAGVAFDEPEVLEVHELEKRPSTATA